MMTGRELRLRQRIDDLLEQRDRARGQVKYLRRQLELVRIRARAGRRV
jgi:hypothetical protein